LRDCDGTFGEIKVPLALDVTLVDLNAAPQTLEEIRCLWCGRL
jgi:hypothetical protein